MYPYKHEDVTLSSVTNQDESAASLQPPPSLHPAPSLRPAVASLPAYVPGARPHPGQQLHKLSSNENPYAPPAAVVQAITRAASSINRYPDMYATQVAAALAEGMGVDPQCVVVGNGSVAVLAHILQAVLGHSPEHVTHSREHDAHTHSSASAYAGAPVSSRHPHADVHACAGEGADEVVYAWRSFEAYPIAVAVAGGRSVQVSLTADARHDLPAMAAAISDRTKVVLVCTPNNPTGTAVAASELEDFLAQVPSHVLVVIDEAYVEFVRGSDQVDAVGLLGRFPNVVVLRTLSKAAGLAGLRVGYAVASPQIAAGIRAVSTPFGVSSLAQEAALAVTAPEVHQELMDQVEEIVAERDRVQASLRDQGWNLPPSEANFIWLPLGAATAHAARLAQEAGLLVRPFEGEGIRVSIGLPEANDALVDLAASLRPASAEAVPAEPASVEPVANFQEATLF